LPVAIKQGTLSVTVADRRFNTHWHIMMLVTCDWIMGPMPVCVLVMPIPAGSRPPKQMHGSLDEGLDESEQQEIQKIISEIHGAATKLPIQ
jgi:hypothetical protein